MKKLAQKIKKVQRHQMRLKAENYNESSNGKNKLIEFVQNGTRNGLTSISVYLSPRRRSSRWERQEDEPMLFGNALSVGIDFCCLWAVEW